MTLQVRHQNPMHNAVVSAFDHIGALPEMAGIRSPILDLPQVEWPENSEEGGTFNWFMDNTWAVPLIVKPFLRQYIASLAMGKPITHSGAPTYFRPENGPWAVAKDVGLGGQAAALEAASKVRKLRDRVRITKTKQGFRMAICAGVENVMDWATDQYSNVRMTTGKEIHDLLDAQTNGDYEKGEKLKQQMAHQTTERFMKMFGRDAAVPEKPIDYRLDPAKVFEETPAANASLFQQLYRHVYGEDEYLPEMPAIFEAFRSMIKSVRLVATPCTSRQNLKVYERTEKGDIIEVTSLEEAEGRKKQKGMEHWYWNWCELILSSRTWYVYVEVDCPMDNAQAMVQAQDPASISTVDMADWVQQMYHYQESDEYTWELKRLKDIHAVNTKLIAVGVKPQPRMSEDHLTLHPDGMMLYIPDTYEVESYEGMMNQNLDPDDGELCYNNPKYENLRWHESAVGEEFVAKRKNTQSPDNRLLLVDWLNNKLAYTNTAGVQSVLDLERCVPVNMSHVYRSLNVAMYGTKKNSASDLAWSMLTSAVKRGKDLAAGLDAKSVFNHAMSPEELEMLPKVLNSYQFKELFQFLESGDIEQAFHALWSGMANTLHWGNHTTTKEDFSKMCPWFEENADDVKLYQFAAKDGLPFLRGFGTLFKEAAKLSLENYARVVNEKSVLSGLRELALLTMIDKYLDVFPQVKAADGNLRSVYLQPKLMGAKYVPQDMPLVKTGDTPEKCLTLMPHQARGADYLSNSPPYAILNVPAGGGKTLTIITNILFELGKGKVKRPLVLCPDHLIKDYVKEANFATNGRLNVICINGESLNSWGEELLLKLVKNAPINTIVVSSYDFLKNRMVKTMYGREMLNISLNCELLRQMSFDGCWMDEVQWLRKVNLRSTSVGRLMAEIPFKRIASGTLVVDQLTDIANEYGTLDPTVFGTPDRFIETYAQSMSGGKVMTWKPGAERAVNDLMSQHAMVINASRREWAALLPPRKERIHFVEMTEAQRGLYDSILEETLAKLKLEDPELYNLLVSSMDDEDSGNLESLLGPYLARLEQFLTSPAEDDASDALPDADKVSPKAKQIEAIIREHIKNKTPGKILIFTSYIASAKTIFEHLPPDLRGMCIHYKASEKFKCAEEFERNPNKIIMVGVEQSMNTGLNFQIASRLIRCESVWSPGVLEQGESRINRPQLKGTDPRTNIFLDWVVVNKTIDVTKIGRLIGKLVSMAKFENPYETAYQALPDVPLISMSLASLRSENDFKEELSDHLAGFNALRKVQELDFEAYRKDPKIDKTFKTVKPGKDLEGAALLSEVPYVSGMDLFGAEDLGLTKFYDYVRVHHDAEANPQGLMCHTEWGDGEVTAGFKNSLRIRLASGELVSVRKMSAFIITKTSTSTKTMRSQLAKLAGLEQANTWELIGDLEESSPVNEEEIDYDLVLTQDGFNVFKMDSTHIIVTDSSNPHVIGKDNVHYKVSKFEGETQWVWYNAKSKKIKYSMPFRGSKAATQDVLKFLTPNSNETEVDVPEAEVRRGKGPVPDAPQTVPDSAINLYLGVGNGSFMISTDGDDPDAENLQLKQFGFVLWNKQYWYCEVKMAKQLRALIDKLQENFTIPASYLADLESAYTLFSQGRNKLLTPDAATRAEFRNFFIDHRKKISDPDTIKPYVYVSYWEGHPECYVVVDINTPAAARLKTKGRVSGLAWVKDTDKWVMAYASTKGAVKEIIDSMTKAGIKIANLKDLMAAWKALKPVRRGNGTEE